MLLRLRLVIFLISKVILLKKKKLGKRRFKISKIYNLVNIVKLMNKLFKMNNSNKS
jgi:predicted RNase H-like nuclease